jgi:hypothetical protein
MKLDESGYIISKDIPIFNKKIRIKISVSYSAKLFFQRNWQWLSGALLGTGTIFETLKLFFKSH